MRDVAVSACSPSPHLSPSKLPVLPEKRDATGQRFSHQCRNPLIFPLSGCSNTNKAKVLCDIPANIAFVIPHGKTCQGKSLNPINLLVTIFAVVYCVLKDSRRKSGWYIKLNYLSYIRTDFFRTICEMLRHNSCSR